MIDEDPSPEDIERFDRDNAFCPDCGAEIWDEAEICPKCFAYLGGKTSSRPPIQNWINSRTMLVVIIALLVAFGFIWFMSRPAAL